ncbi:MAG: indolepyruvate ferredoxin oxidoreductase family protein [Hyphomicrobiales bacterium]|nr:indolepyruvate ferredoxin oxidoreductase family protein [Hyphomicrobiales bacterium]MDE2115171.1 indolepyruvate ferredoxin oxidoreductase family protein [Hyphomicrobiales bacterium]
MPAKPSTASTKPTRLDDRYTQTSGTVFMSGNQALVRLPIQQRLVDQAAGLNTGGFISGYRGSPLGRYDMELWSAAQQLQSLGIKFQPGVNEDLAATAVWGSQNVGLVPGAKVEGVFGLWYGKGPGVDRSGDVFKHANLAGTSPKGGVLVLAGDDHGAKSSTTAHQSEPALMAAGMPILAPSNVQEILDYGLHGIALSRFSGCWVAMKLVTDVVESASTASVDLDRVKPVIPPVPPIPGGVSIRLHDMPQVQEARLYQAKLPLSVAYARANGLNRVMAGADDAKIGIVTAGKSYPDTLQALSEMGIRADAAGIAILKLGMVFPLDPEVVVKFAAGKTALLVIEEKRPLIENQIKSTLFDAALPGAPKVLGKALLSPIGELAPNVIAHAIAKVLGREALAAGVPLAPPMKFDATGRPILGPMRLPSFCSGCPHNTSTKLPDGSRALAGIGCHTIAMLNSPQNTMMVSHMGGEGVLWTGQAPFTSEPHVFANMGDGTYFHSGLLAIRQAVAAKADMTYKLLYNGFVSMTGGQPVDGELSVPRTILQLQSEGVAHIVVVTEDLERVRALGLPAGVPLRPRSELDAVQRELREMKGTTVLIYDQACATERRRLRKRGKWADPKIRTFIHPEICEGCGDCGQKSGCLSIEPLDTDLGRKRQINQSSCNKDFSCVQGFCPSFVTVHGAELRVGAAAAGVRPPDDAGLPLPETTLTRDQLGVLFTGIGGTGVVTVGAIVSMAAHIDGLAVSTLDVTGLAQKYGAVMTHMRIAHDPARLTSSRLAMGEADVVVGCDLLVTAGDEALSRLRKGTAQLVINSEEVPTSEFARNPDWAFSTGPLTARLSAMADGRFALVDAVRLATALCGDAVFANIFLLGVAWQKGLLPVSLGALQQAIQLNGVKVDMNRAAFTWGRAYAADPARVTGAAALAAHSGTASPFAPMVMDGLPDIIADRVKRLTAYQNARFAAAYKARLDALAKAGVPEATLKTVARQYYRLLAHKDEFEVGRLYTDPAFRATLEQEFEGDLKVHYHIGGGWLARKDKQTGEPKKTEKSTLMPQAMAVLSRMRGLRGTAFDPFRNSAERKLANTLRAQYEADLDHIAASPTTATVADLAAWPEKVRGFGHVRERSAKAALAARESLLNPAAPSLAAE